MQVISELADIEIQVGAISREGNSLVISSAPDSTLNARIVVSPHDALATIRRVLASPSVWLFLLRLPLAVFRRKPNNTAERAWQERRQRTGLNKPW